MDLLTHEVLRFAMVDPFLARPPYFQSDLIHVRQKRYLRAIDSAAVEAEAYASPCQS
jgi:hypothetical protein